jgi:cytochrome c553
MKLTRWAFVLGVLAFSSAHADDAERSAETVMRAVHVCASCHGEGGRSGAAVYPNLAGQVSLYTIAQLRDFRSQTRAETDVQAYMWGVSALLDDATIQGLADYYASQSPAPGRVRNQKLADLGRKIFNDGIPGRKVRACATCHGDQAQGASVFPRLAGQHADYVFRQLRGFSSPLRKHGVLMKEESAQMSEMEMRAVAEYVQSL